MSFSVNYVRIIVIAQNQAKMKLIGHLDRTRTGKGSPGVLLFTYLFNIGGYRAQLRTKRD